MGRIIDAWLSDYMQNPGWVDPSSLPNLQPTQGSESSSSGVTTESPSIVAQSAQPSALINPYSALFSHLFNAKQRATASFGPQTRASSLRSLLNNSFRETLRQGARGASSYYGLSTDARRTQATLQMLKTLGPISLPPKLQAIFDKYGVALRDNQGKERTLDALVSDLVSAAHRLGPDGIHQVATELAFTPTVAALFGKVASARAQDNAVKTTAHQAEANRSPSAPKTPSHAALFQQEWRRRAKKDAAHPQSLLAANPPEVQKALTQLHALHRQGGFLRGVMNAFFPTAEAAGRPMRQGQASPRRAGTAAKGKPLSKRTARPRRGRSPQRDCVRDPNPWKSNFVRKPFPTKPVLSKQDLDQSIQELVSWPIYSNLANSIELIEHGSLDQMGGGACGFVGYYQMGRQAISNAAKYRNMKIYPASADLLGDQRKQDTFYEAFTLDNRRMILTKFPKFASLNQETQAVILAFAHNQGAPATKDWLSTGKMGSDGFGAVGTLYAIDTALGLQNLPLHNGYKNNYPMTRSVYIHVPDDMGINPGVVAKINAMNNLRNIWYDEQKRNAFLRYEGVDPKRYRVRFTPPSGLPNNLHVTPSEIPSDAPITPNNEGLGLDKLREKRLQLRMGGGGQS